MASVLAHSAMLSVGDAGVKRETLPVLNHFRLRVRAALKSPPNHEGGNFSGFLPKAATGQNNRSGGWHPPPSSGAAKP